MHRIRRVICIIFIGISCIWSTGCTSGETGDELQDIEISEEDTEEEQSGADWIYVHVCGEIKNPGVYELGVGSRVYEAIEAAGGLTEDAATEGINQAKLLEDGQQLLIPSIHQMESSADDGKININQASKEELMTLSGIGEAKADAIIRYREAHGGFQSPEELMEIEGIKEGVFQKVKDQIKVS